MSVYIDSFDKIAQKLGIQPDGPVQAFIVNTCYKAMDEFVPRDEGNLRKNVSLYKDRVTYESPYASYQYHGEREDGSRKIKHWTTPGTGPYWDRRMVTAKMDRILKDVKKVIGE